MSAPHSYLDPTTAHFVFENYNWDVPHSNFLPGIAGKWGVPVWCYLVNRGQCVASFGVRDKDGQILEFYSFNKACMRVEREGFRTFVRLGDKQVYEPFRRSDDERIAQTMIVAPGEITLRETNPTLGLEFEVVYFGLPGERVAGLVRMLTVRNLKKKERRLDLVDGLPRILPFGLDQARIKGIPRHIEGMMGVTERGGAAMFRLKQTADDSERVGRIEGGNFYLRVGVEGTRGLIVDPEAVFAEPFNYDSPRRFADSGARGVLAAEQFWENKTPAAMTARSVTLKEGAATTLCSVFGYAPSDGDLDTIAARSRRASFVEEKRAENRRTVEEVADHAFTVSASPEFDAYSRQDFLDNVIRGGMPMTLTLKDKKSTLYLYSRQNGDLERDYHYFVLDPTYLSQGTGHYRSVLQNRRTDTWFFPDIEATNLRTFMNLIQLDGYNPLEVLGAKYRSVDPEAAAAWAQRRIDSPKQRAELLAWLEQGFSPGQLILRLEDLITLEADRRTSTLDEVLSFCDECEVGGLHEGFWVDHWHYNVDLLEVVLMVYPDRVDDLLMGDKSYTYFDDPDVVLPRHARSVSVGGKVRSYGAVYRDPEKLALIETRAQDPHVVRTEGGHGEVYRTTLLAKLLTIVVNRLATLDAGGTGIEMEAGKPGWNDSMNGLPGVFGSGLSETLELARTVKLLRTLLPRLKGGRTRTLAVYSELAEFLRGVQAAMKKRLTARSNAALNYWNEANALKEHYRDQTRLGVGGTEERLPLSELSGFLSTADEFLERIFSGRNRAKVISKAGVPFTYFVNDVTKHEPTGETNHLGLPTTVPAAFDQRPVKLFLEGPVHWLKHRPEEALAVYEAVRKSPLFDRKLKMYKSCENMRGESPELGRAVGAYPRGWIENESIYLHMEYKYLLEVLRSGLCEQFWADAETALVPFMDPAVYGRSILEGASFIVSSAFAQSSLHGRAFQPRLSGITCEFLHMWLLAVAGEQPLRLDRQGKLELALEPRLPGWLFTEQETRREYHDFRDGWTEVVIPENAFAFKLLGRTLVVYANKNRKDTYGTGAARPRSYELLYRSGRRTTVNAKVLPLRHARAVRNGDVLRMDVALR